jgi:hypothetical protein
MTSLNDMSDLALARDTLRRSKDVHDVNGRVFRGLAVLMASLAGVFVTMTSGVPTRIAIVISAALFLPAFVYYVVGMADCRRYTSEMNARTAELKRRTGLE